MGIALRLRSVTRDWGLGIGDCTSAPLSDQGLGIGDWGLHFGSAQ
ncbi:MAG: hypothetical protein HEQ35_31345 [Gloeotrichia echinulata IR180]